MSAKIDPKKYAVLYVDDEEQALKYFQKGLGKDFTIFTASSVDAALPILEREAGRIAVVLTDQRMPGRQGTDLLAAVKQKWPNTVRILITAYSDIESAIAAVNSGSISKYLTKPASFPVLKQTLTEALDQFFAQLEREEMLAEKMSVLRQAVVSDRVRSFAEFANGLSHHVRNSVTAINCLLEELDPGQRAQATNVGSERSEYTDQLWALANSEQAQLLQMVQKIQDCAVAPAAASLSDVDLQQLIAHAAETVNKKLGAARVTVQANPAAVSVKADASMLVSALTALIVRAASSGPVDGKVALSASGPVSLWNAPAVRILVQGEGAAWSDQTVATFFTPYAFPEKEPSELGTGLLMAYFAAQQHGGDVVVHREAPAGPGFELLLPLDPSEVVKPQWKDDLLENVLKGAPTPPIPSTA